MAVEIRRVAEAIRKHLTGDLGKIIFDPERSADDPRGTLFAAEVLRSAIVPPPANILPLAQVCDLSLACVVCDRDIDDPTFGSAIAYEVVRWHLGRIAEDAQGEILDVDPLTYLDSLASELRSRDPARRAVDIAAKDYYQAYVLEEARPRSDVLRPVQLACQNVIVGLATLRHDPIFDGLRVESYATCEVAHLATGEADRAMAALLLCDAFQSGGTMEIRFGRSPDGVKPKDPSRPDRSPELPVPPALRRYARARGLALGQANRHSISPAEARDLFLLVTPMSDELRLQALTAFDSGRISPERLCYALMAGVWRDVEVAYLLATSRRATTILEGGSDPSDRIARSCEAESCRTALMLGLLLARIEQSGGGPGSASVNLVEDDRNSTSWAIRPDLGAVTMAFAPGNAIPWRDDADLSGSAGALVVLARAVPDHTDVELAIRLRVEEPEALICLLVPEDADVTGLSDIPILRCPQSLGLLDQAVRRKLDTMRNSRR